MTKLKTKTVAYDNNEKRMESVYSKRIRAGKRRTYFFDIRATRSNDYYLTITESRKKFNEDGYDRHKLFLYKEDFNKFIKALTEAVDFVKTDLMPDFDFDAYNHDNIEGEGTDSRAGDEPAERDNFSSTGNIMGKDGIGVKDGLGVRDDIMRDGVASKDGLGKDTVGEIKLSNVAAPSAAPARDEEVDKW